MDAFADCFGRGPLSVLPEYQRQGIGTALVQAGLARLLLGRPTSVLPEVRLRYAAGLVYEGTPPEVFLALSFDGQVPLGSVIVHEAFGARSG